MQNIGARGGIGGRGEGDRLHTAERGLHRAERGIFGTEVVAPLRDAMRLVDRQQRDLAALEKIERVCPDQPFRRDINQPQLAARDALEHGAVFVGIVGGVERRGGDAIAAQLRDLVAHQRDQWRHHDGEPVAQQRRKLVAQRLAAAGRHHRQHVAAVENGGNDLGLAGPECPEAEGFAKCSFAPPRGRT